MRDQLLTILDLPASATDEAILAEVASNRIAAEDARCGNTSTAREREIRRRMLQGGIRREQAEVAVDLQAKEDFRRTTKTASNGKAPKKK